MEEKGIEQEYINKVDECGHYWQRHQDSGKCSCRRCGISQNVDAKTMHIHNHNYPLQEDE